MTTKVPKSSKTQNISALVLVITWIVAVFVYPALPERVASHWNAFGLVDGYTGRWGGAFYIPLLVTFLTVILTYLPHLDPRHDNIKKFRQEYDRFILFLVLFLNWLYLFTLLWNLGYPIPINLFLAPALALLLMAMSQVMEHTQSNWLIGVRTPWTLSNDRVWKKAHQFAAKAYKIAAALIILTALGPQVVTTFVSVIAILGASLATVIYSYVLYQQESS